jgi:peptidoglycan/xylan/chitin deacetylase (PgdA/CDA1 family)
MGRLRTTATPVLRTMRLEGPILSVAGSLQGVTTDQPVFHLTFDDGPHPELTPRILDVLDEFDAKATFFVLTERAIRYSEVLHETMRRGHEIGLHSRTHLRLTTLGWSRLRDEVLAARRDLEDLASRPIKWFRPPYGAQSIRTLAVVGAGRMKTMLWSVDSQDWTGLSPDDPLRRATGRLAHGGILLMHDVPVDEQIGRDGDRGFITKDELTRLYLQEMQRRHIRAVSIEELLETGTMLRKVKLG